MTPVEQIGTPVDLRPLFAQQRHGLISFLKGLSPDDWRAPTACTNWNVADLTAHLLGDVIGRISGGRDRNLRAIPHTNESLGEFIDRINNDWVMGSRRLSTALLIEMLEWGGQQHDEFWLGLEANAPSLGVSWAGVDPAPVWFDAAREVTEYWVHERQLREAVGDTRSGTPDLNVILDVFARGLPYTLNKSHLGSADLGGAQSFSLAISPTGPSWGFALSPSGWAMVAPSAIADVSFDGEGLWRRWTRQVDAPDFEIANPAPLEVAVLEHVAIIHSDP